MDKLYKYYVRETGDFGGCGIDSFTKGFNDYDEAIAYYKKEIESFSHWRSIPEVEFIDGIAKAEKELASLKAKVIELEAMLKILKES